MKGHVGAVMILALLMLVLAPLRGAEDASSEATGEPPTLKGSFERLEPSALSGKPAPDFRMQVIDGGTFHLAGDGKGKCVVVLFTATWGRNSQSTLKELGEVSDRFERENVAVVGVYHPLKADTQTLRGELARAGVGFPVGIDRSGITGAYLVEGMPTTVIIGRDGIVQGWYVGWTSGLGEYLAYAVEDLLKGRSLSSPSAVAQEGERGSRPGLGAVWMGGLPEFPDSLFVLEWRKRLGGHLRFPDLAKGAVKLTPHWFPVLVGGELVLLEPSSGAELNRIPVPSSARQLNEQEQPPDYVVLRTPRGMVAIAVQTYYEVKVTGENHKSYTPRSQQLTAFTEKGESIWSLKLDGFHIQEAASVSVGTEDWLLLIAWGKLRLYNGSGKKLLEHTLGFGHQLTVADSDQDGAVEFYLTGPLAACYELRSPLPGESGHD